MGKETRLLPFVALALAFFAGKATEAAVPEVIAEFRIESEMVEEFLETSEALLEEDVAGFLVAEGEAHFPFVRWVTSSGATGDAAPRLVLRLVERSHATCPPGLELRLDAAVRGQEIQLSEPLRLYHGCDPSPPFTHSEDLSTFRNDLAAVIHVLAGPEPAPSVSSSVDCVDCLGWFFSEPLRKQIEADFLGEVSLVDRLDCPAEEKQVLLPLRMEELKAKTSSRLLVEFWIHSDPPQDPPKEIRGELWLSPWAGMGDSIHCKLTKLTVPPDIHEPESEFFWHESLPSLLADSSLLRLDVFMKAYFLDRFAGDISDGGAVTKGP